MSGDEQCRHCEACDKNVYNLSAMSLIDIESLIKKEEKGERVCVRLYKRADGTVLTEDCPIGLAAVKAHLKRKQFIAALICFLGLVFGSQSLAGGKHKLMGKIAPNHLMGTPAVMGEIVAPLPEPIPEPPVKPQPQPKPEGDNDFDEDKAWQ